MSLIDCVPPFKVSTQFIGRGVQSSTDIVDSEGRRVLRVFSLGHHDHDKRADRAAKIVKLLNKEFAE